MGLDISYYSKIKISESNDDDDDNYIENHKYFIYQLGSLKNGQCYHETDESESDSFHVGSCSGYGVWRKNLLEMLGYISMQDVFNDFDTNIRKIKLDEINSGEKYVAKSFYEIIIFSDCEGVIGPEISKKLYEDFVEFDKVAISQGDYFYDIYSKFKEAFRVASDNGLVCFS